MHQTYQNKNCHDQTENDTADLYLEGIGIPKELKVKILKCLIWPVVLYGCEAALTLKQDAKN